MLIMIPTLKLELNRCVINNNNNKINRISINKLTKKVDSREAHNRLNNLLLLYVLPVFEIRMTGHKSRVTKSMVKIAMINHLSHQLLVAWLLRRHPKLISAFVIIGAPPTNQARTTFSKSRDSIRFTTKTPIHISSH